MCGYLSLTFPQRVDIENRRLKYVYVLLMMAVLAFNLTCFWMLELWASRRPVGEHIYPGLWVEGAGTSGLEQIWSERGRARLCSTPRDFDYWGGEAGERRYENHTCAPPCGLGVVSGQCLSLEETYLREGASEVFVVTHVQETLLSTGRPSASRSRSYFLPLAEGLRVSLQYSYAVPKLTAYASSYLQAQQEVGSSRKDTKTVILTKQGQTWRQLPPGTAITLSVEELMELAGEQGQLDAPQTHLGPNALSGSAVSDGPIGRISGIALAVQLSCFNQQSFSSNDGKPMCYVKVAREMPGWVSTERTELMGMDLRHRHYHGIRITVRTGGFFSSFSYAGTLHAMTSAMVLMEIPAKLVLIIAVACLGRLSRVYREVLFQSFNLRTQISGISARLLATASSYDAFEKSAGGSVCGLGLPQNRVRRRLVKAMAPHLQQRQCPERGDGVERFLDYSWHSLVGSGAGTRSSKPELEAMQRLANGFRPGRSPSDASALDYGHFAAACGSAGPLALETLLGLFDPHRRPGPLERAFQPAEFESVMGCNSKAKPPREPWPILVPFRGSHSSTYRESDSGSVVIEGNLAEASFHEVTGKQAVVQGEDREGCSPSTPRKPGRKAVVMASQDSEDPADAPLECDGLQARDSVLLQTTGEHKSYGNVLAAGLEELNERINSLDSFRVGFLTFEARIEELEASVSQRLRKVESKVSATLKSMEARLQVFEGRASFLLDAGSPEAGENPRCERLVTLEQESSRHDQELLKLHQKTELLGKSLASAERALAFAAVQQEEMTYDSRSSQSSVQQNSPQGTAQSPKNQPVMQGPKKVSWKDDPTRAMRETAAILFAGHTAPSGQQGQASQSPDGDILPGISHEGVRSPVLPAPETMHVPLKRSFWHSSERGSTAPHQKPEPALLSEQHPRPSEEARSVRGAVGLTSCFRASNIAGL